MHHGPCNVVYVDRRAREGLVRSLTDASDHGIAGDATSPPALSQQPADVARNIDSLLATFDTGNVLALPRPFLVRHYQSRH